MNMNVYFLILFIVAFILYIKKKKIIIIFVLFCFVLFISLMFYYLTKYYITILVINILFNLKNIHCIIICIYVLCAPLFQYIQIDLHIFHIPFILIQNIYQNTFIFVYYILIFLGINFFIFFFFLHIL